MIKVLKKIHLYGMWIGLSRFLVNHILVGTRLFSIKRKLLLSCGWKIGEGTKIVGPVQVTGTVSIGKDCWIGKNFMVNGNGHVSIGDNCDIAPEVIINTGGHEIGDANRRAGKGVVYNAEIGNGTWVCARSTILQNTRIGNSCIVAACACVISDVEDNTLVGGVPAKLIRRLSEA